MRSRLARWLQTRGWRRLPRLLKLPRWWPWLLLAVLLPICLVNLAVAWVGRCSFLLERSQAPRYKVEALGSYAWHRPHCAVVADTLLTAPLLARAEREHHLPCGLLGAIVLVESGGQPHRISAAGAMGPMQLIPPTARAMGVSDPFNPEQSVDGAARYLPDRARSWAAMSRRTARPRSTSTASCTLSRPSATCAAFHPRPAKPAEGARR